LSTTTIIPTKHILRIWHAAESVKLESQHYWLGKCADGSFIRYLSSQPMQARAGRVFVGAIGPFLSPLSAAYYAHREAESLSLLTPQQAERLAREDSEGGWPLAREQILLEMTMSDQEIIDTLCDMAQEYELS
jgi:hypothetical protein